MSVGLLLITHGQIGSALLESATSILGICPLNTECLSVAPYSEPQQISDQARGVLRQIDQGSGALVLTDLFGSTPSNIACSLYHPGQVRVIAGVNLPMLIKIFNYARLDLDALVDKALAGGCRGVMEYQPDGQ